MSKLGEHREDLDVDRYERILKLHTQCKNGKDFNFYNILNKIEFPDDIDPTYISTYLVPTRMPLTAITFNVYGNMFLWWVLYLMNKKEMSNLFYVEGGTTLKYIDGEYLTLVYNQITRDTIYNGRHF